MCTAKRPLARTTSTMSMLWPEVDETRSAAPRTNLRKFVARTLRRARPRSHGANRCVACRLPATKPRFTAVGANAGFAGVRTRTFADSRAAQNHHGRESGRILRGECAWQESNLRPCAPEAHALSPELQARGRLV